MVELEFGSKTRRKDMVWEVFGNWFDAVYSGGGDGGEKEEEDVGVEVLSIPPHP